MFHDGEADDDANMRSKHMHFPISSLICNVGSQKVGTDLRPFSI